MPGSARDISGTGLVLNMPRTWFTVFFSLETKNRSDDYFVFDAPDSD